MLINPFLLGATTLYQLLACWQEDRCPPPGKQLDVGGYSLHYVLMGQGEVTVVIDHSLGGI